MIKNILKERYIQLEIITPILKIMSKKPGDILVLTNYLQISKYWTENPCAGGNPDFPFWHWKDKRILEIGCGAGIDAERFVKAKALYTGIDLTDEAITLTKKCINADVKQMNAEFLDFPDETFDLVYSFGVIHHALNPENIVNEAYRVLKPSGHIFLMLYNKFSFRYLIEIMFLRKILWWLRYPKYSKLKKQTFHPTKEQWISWNTDTLGCPLARVYTKKTASELLNKFKITNTWTENKGWFRMIIGRKG